MRMARVRPDQFARAVANVAPRYGGNLAVHPDAHPVGSATVGRVYAPDSKGPGARRSYSGRRGPWACWHAYRDVLRELFTISPDATITTTMARYTAANFETTYPATAYRNIGSRTSPAYMDEMCDCDE